VGMCLQADRSARRTLLSDSGIPTILPLLFRLAVSGLSKCDFGACQTS